METNGQGAESADRSASSRSSRAWQEFSPNGYRCRFCNHSPADHLVRASQPHYLTPATAGDLQEGRRLTTIRTESCGPMLARRIAVQRAAEVAEIYCLACAEELGTHQAVCYSRRLANGELVPARPRKEDVIRPGRAAENANDME